jgi:lysophospholipase L1-like esterase
LGTPATFSGAKFIIYDPANDPGTQDFAGTVPTISGQNARTAALPMLFVGRYTGPGHLSVIGIGDSILHGLGDSENPTPVITGFGFFNRAALDANGSNTIAMLNLTRSGETANTWVNNHARQVQLLTFANVVVEEFGTNDIGSNGSSANATNIYNRLVSIWTTGRDAGAQRIVRSRLLPRTASASGNWTSLGDQTPNPGWGTGGARDQLNALLANALTHEGIDALVGTLSPVSDPTDDHYWLSNGTNDYMTNDGTHPRPAGYALLAPSLRAALLALSAGVLVLEA